MRSYDVVVVGAGFSGLAAARDLRAGGADVLVLEASDRVGGRTDTRRDGDRWIELGGQWSGPGQERVLALAAQFAVPTFSTPTAGQDLLVSGGRVLPDSEAPGAEAVAAAIGRLDALAATLPVGEPWAAPDADLLDAMSLAAWLDASVEDLVARRRLRQHLEGLMTVSANDMSVLSILHCARSSGTLTAALGIEGGAQEVRLLGGMHQLAERLAEGLADSIRVNSSVTDVDARDTDVLLRTAGEEVAAQRVVLAIPPSMVGALDIAPALPAAAGALGQWMPMGAVIKVNAVFPRPFWRAAGWSGLVTDDDGPFAFMVDNSSPESNEGVLTTFLSARAATQWGDARNGSSAAGLRRRMFTEHVHRVFGSAAVDPVDYVDRDWVAQPWIGGGYSGVMRPGGWTTSGRALREPVGRIHWASSERAVVWTGYVEGALESGERAAREVLSALG